MRLKEIEETIRGPNYELAAKKFAETNKDLWLKKGLHIGDIEEYRVVKYQHYYSLWQKNTLAAFSSLNGNIVDDVWVGEDFRGQKLFSKLLWFYKTRLGIPQLELGRIHSPQMQEVVKGLSRFKKFWKNTRTGVVEPFDINTLDQYYDSIAPTDWRLVLENLGDFGWLPLFATGSSFIAEDYTEIIK